MSSSHLQHQSHFINQLETRKIYHYDSTVTSSTNQLENDQDDSTLNLQLKAPLKYSSYDFRKDFFIMPQKLDGESVEHFRENSLKTYRNEHNIQLFHFKQTTDNLPIALPQFRYFQQMLPEVLLKRLTSKFSSPMPVQAQAWPLLLQGHDLIGLAETGSGKTLGFLVPAFVHLLDQLNTLKNIKDHKHVLKTNNGPILVILAPTRELALQIDEEIAFLKDVTQLEEEFENKQMESSTASRKSESSSLTEDTSPAENSARQQYMDLLKSVRSVCIVGGQTRKKQIRKAMKGCEIVVGTPGRILDFLVEGVFDLQRTTYVVMDEADRMLELGFQSQIRKVIGQIRPDRQMSMFSATWDKGVQDLSGAFLNNPFILSIGSATNAANTNVKQEFRFMRPSDKEHRLLELLEELIQDPSARMLIFCNSKRNADELVVTLRGEGWPSLSLHGDRSQQERQWVVNEFKSGGTPILCATDVAARGLDIDDVQWVVNYDMPNDISIYVHRIGRTGRAGKEGHSISFFTPSDCFITGDVIEVLTKSKQEVPKQLKELRELVLEEDKKRKRRNQHEEEEKEREASRRNKKRKRKPDGVDKNRKHKKKQHNSSKKRRKRDDKG